MGQQKLQQNTHNPSGNEKPEECVCVGVRWGGGNVTTHQEDRGEAQKKYFQAPKGY